jgi:chemotaxis protein CheC
MDVPEEVRDGVRELLTIGVGRSAGMLNRLTNAHVTLTVPDVHISDDISEYMREISSRAGEGENNSRVILNFSGEFTGSFSLIITHSSALNLVILLTGEESSLDEMDALREETLLEVGNIITSAVMSALGILLKSRLSFQFPTYRTEAGDLSRSLSQEQSDIGIIARIHFTVHQKEIDGSIFIFLTRESYENLKTSIITIMEKGL